VKGYWKVLISRMVGSRNPAEADEETTGQMKGGKRNVESRTRHECIWI